MPKRKKQVYTAFAYKLLYSTITVWTRSAAMTTVSTANSVAIALANCTFTVHLAWPELLYHVETPWKWAYCTT